MKVFSHALGTQTYSWSESVIHSDQMARFGNIENDRHVEGGKKEELKS